MKKLSAFDVGMQIILVLFALLCLIPFVLLIVSSFASETSIMKYGYSFWPKEWSLDSYRYLLGQGAS